MERSLINYNVVWTQIDLDNNYRNYIYFTLFQNTHVLYILANT